MGRTSTKLCFRIRDSPKVDVWCGLMNDHVIRLFMFVENTIIGSVYLDMLEMYEFHKVKEIVSEKDINC